jgi:hypothetical protein
MSSASFLISGLIDIAKYGLSKLIVKVKKVKK